MDHETQVFFNITVAAQDLGSPTLSGYAHVLVTVLDMDDNAPVFHKDHYTAEILENATAGTFVAQVNATDLDAADLHRTVHYRIEKGNDEKLFVIGELNGTVSLNWTGMSLDREKVPRYSLIIAAISKVNDTEQKSTATVNISHLSFEIALNNLILFTQLIEGDIIFRKKQKTNKQEMVNRLSRISFFCYFVISSFSDYNCVVQIYSYYETQSHRQMFLECALCTLFVLIFSVDHYSFGRE